MHEDLAFIYEFDKNSPSFISAAMNEFNNGNYNKTIEIVFEGIDRFENYLTPYVILFNTFLKRGNFTGAQQVLEEKIKFIANKKIYERFFQQFTKAKKVIDSSDLNEKKVLPGVNELKEVLETEGRNALKSKSDFFENNKSNIKTTLKKLETSEEENVKPNSFDNETMANIYFEQGYYQRALSIYEKLVKTNPPNLSKIQKKIDTIRNYFLNK